MWPCDTNLGVYYMLHWHMLIIIQIEMAWMIYIIRPKIIMYVPLSVGVRCAHRLTGGGGVPDCASQVRCFALPPPACDITCWVHSFLLLWHWIKIAAAAASLARSLQSGVHWWLRRGAYRHPGKCMLLLHGGISHMFHTLFGLDVRSVQSLYGSICL